MAAGNNSATQVEMHMPLWPSQYSYPTTAHNYREGESPLWPSKYSTHTHFPHYRGGESPLWPSQCSIPTYAPNDREYPLELVTKKYRCGILEGALNATQSFRALRQRRAIFKTTVDTKWGNSPSAPACLVPRRQVCVRFLQKLNRDCAENPVAGWEST